MKLPRRIALLLGVVTVALAFWLVGHGPERTILLAIFIAASAIAFATFALVPRYHAQRRRVTVGLLCYSAAAGVAAIAAIAVGETGSAIAGSLLLAAGLATARRSAYQAPLRRTRRFDDYFELKRS